jgi:transcriptional regulator with XRE-family HTH domain
LETLRHIREQAGLSQPELSEISGVAQGTISDIELSKRKPRGRTLRKLAQALGVQVADLIGESETLKVQAPPSPEQPPLNGFEEERREAAGDVALDAARRQARQDAQAAARAIESGRPQTYFMRHDNEAIQRLLGYPKDELAGAVLEVAERAVDEEQRPSPLAASLASVIRHWLKIIDDSPAESTAGAVNLALHLENQLTVLMGDEKQWDRVTPIQRSEIFQLMKLIEDLAERYMARMEAEAGHAEVIDLNDLRLRLEQSRESRRRAEAHSA